MSPLIEKDTLNRLSLLAITLFCFYLVAQLGFSLYTWRQMRSDAETELVAESQRRAVALSDVLDMLQTKAKAVAEQREIETYLNNRDLGMSMQYGLGASLQAIRDRFTLHTRQEHPLNANRLVYLGRDGALLVDTARNPPLPTFSPAAPGVTVDAESQTVMVTAMVLHKGEPEGMVISFFPVQILYRSLRADSVGAGTDALLAGEQILAGSNTTTLPAELAAVLEHIPVGQVVNLDSVPSAKVLLADREELLAVRTPIPVLSLQLISLVPAKTAFGHTVPSGLLLLLIVAPILLLWSAARLDQKRREAVDKATRAARMSELANAAKSDFLANMSHELRTPLNSILAVSETLLEQVRGPLNQRQLTSLRHIETSGHHLLDLINDLLDIAKVEAGRFEMFPEEVDVASVCEGCLAFIRPTAVSKKLHLGLQTDSRTPQLYTDPKRLRQILLNLLNNSVKFTPEGGSVRLEVDTLTDRDSIRFAVRDTGIGIAAENLERLFRPFTQLDAGLNRQHEGTGLGLALVQRLVELQGGSVTVESEPSKGSCFTVLLPLTEPPSALAPLPRAIVPGVVLPPPLPPRRADGDRNALARRQTALVIEDSEVAAAQMSTYLKEMGFNVSWHPSGEGALEAATRLWPNIILLDILLPGRSGWEILSWLKARPGLRDIPVVVASVVDEPMRALRCGAAAHLLKPLSRDTLLKALASVSGLLISPATAGGPQPHILLTDDNETTLQVIGDYLETKGFRVTLARNGKEALDLVERNRPDLVLMDIQMPGMDGLETMRLLRIMPGCGSLPIIALTALAMPDDRDKCLAAGADDYLVKPVSVKNLVTVIQRLMQIRP